METDGSFRFILLVITLLFSAFFSGAEVALFSLDKKIVKDLKNSQTLIGKYISSLVEAPRRLLVTILVGNTIFNVAASIIAVTIAVSFANAYNYDLQLVLIAQIVILTIIVLFFGEVIPKVYASKNSLSFAKIVAIPLYWINVILYPISKTLTDLIRSVSKRFSNANMKTALTSSEFTDLAELGVESGTLEADEHELIHGLFSFKTITAREVMTPRVDVTAVSHTTTFPELMKIITESGHSRLPLFKENLDEIAGIIYAKDLLPYINSYGENEISLPKLAREAVFIPESKLISELLHEFQDNKTHIGIVVDEYGGTAGIITLEDILEEIVGEIRDEYDKEEQEITKQDENNYLVLGKASIDDVIDILGIDISSENDDYDTIGGFIFNHAGTIPQVGYKFKFGNYFFEVIELENNRISKIQISKHSGTT